jgi:type IV secretion system protein VirB2
MGDRTKLGRGNTGARRTFATGLALALLGAALAAGAAQAQSVRLDPAGSNVILTAVNWLQGTLLGNVATALAVIAVGATGLLMLTGRIDWRRGATVILGCFIVFGAAAIVAGIRSVAAGS